MRALVLGVGISGSGAIKLLKSFKYEVVAVDNILDTSIFNLNFDLIIKSPGIYYDNKLVKYCVKNNLKMISDIELAYILKPINYIAVTGTNGKSTVCTLIHSFFKDQAVLAGNIGISICEALTDNLIEYAICELSSYQLKQISTFKPKLACILNIENDHIQYHKTFEDYKNSKFKIIENFKSNDILVCDENTSLMLGETKFKKIVFSINDLVGDFIVYGNERIISIKDIKLVGKHNILNVIASIYIAKIIGISNKRIQESIKSFKGLPHRIEYVGNIKSKVIYNDSKSTNITSLKVAINSFNESIILIMGGYNKDEHYNDINMKNVVKIIAFGDVKEKIFKKFDNVLIARDLKDACKLSKKINGNIVLFSPGHSSFDSFSSFEERGNYFKKWIMEE